MLDVSHELLGPGRERVLGEVSGPGAAVLAHEAVEEGQQAVAVEADAVAGMRSS